MRIYPDRWTLLPTNGRAEVQVQNNTRVIYKYATSQPSPQPSDFQSEISMFGGTDSLGKVLEPEVGNRIWLRSVGSEAIIAFQDVLDEFKVRVVNPTSNVGITGTIETNANITNESIDVNVLNPASETTILNESLNVVVTEAVEVVGGVNATVINPNAIQVQNYLEKNIKDGKQWEINQLFTNVQQGAGNGRTIKFEIGSKPVIIKLGEISTDAQISQLRTLINPTNHTNSTVIQAYNMNQNSTEILETQIRIATNLTGGTDAFSPLTKKIMGGSTSNSVVRIGGAVASGLERILKPNTTYFFYLENQGTASCDFAVHLNFYEGTYN